MSTTLHLFCGKIAAGKSTLAKRLAHQSGALLISEDDWISGLFGPEMESFDDYIRCSARLRATLSPHLVALLKAGNSIALDFPANTRTLRSWMRGIAEEAGVSALLHYLDLPDVACKKRLCERNASGAHAFSPSEAEFDLISGYFEAPETGEGLPVLVHGGP
ncbi:AAA family ATPase [Nisaea sediminum]|uniref:AAA family ATPase n=1 Tax=Nisaea sediminum TaxID=2775867 RepID=UPI001868F666|nr:ATP-binding protein [Nisaea sediminum]